jgi:hypothetical protein
MRLCMQGGGPAAARSPHTARLPRPGRRVRHCRCNGAAASSVRAPLLQPSNSNRRAKPLPPLNTTPGDHRFGEVLDRHDACRNGSVTVMITDSCARAHLPSLRVVNGGREPRAHAPTRPMYRRGIARAGGRARCRLVCRPVSEGKSSQRNLAWLRRRQRGRCCGCSRPRLKTCAWLLAAAPGPCIKPENAESNKRCARGRGGQPPVPGFARRVRPAGAWALPCRLAWPDAPPVKAQKDYAWLAFHGCRPFLPTCQVVLRRPAPPRLELDGLRAGGGGGMHCHHRRQVLGAALHVKLLQLMGAWRSPGGGCPADARIPWGSAPSPVVPLHWHWPTRRPWVLRCRDPAPRPYATPGVAPPAPRSLCRSPTPRRGSSLFASAW